MFPQVGQADGLVKRSGAAFASVPADGFLSNLTFEPVHTCESQPFRSRKSTHQLFGCAARADCHAELGWDTMVRSVAHEEVGLWLIEGAAYKPGIGLCPDNAVS